MKNLKKILKNKKINTNIKKYVELYLNELIENFDENFNNYFFTTNDNYKIKYKVINLNKEFILLKCADKNCGIKAKIKYLNNDLLSGIILTDNNNNTKFISEEHIIQINLHKSYIKDFIFKSFANLIKKEIFYKSENNEYISEYCKEYFIRNPDISTDMALSILSKKFNTNYEDEIKILYNNIKIGKLFMYNNKHLLNNYINNLESIVDNQNKKYAFPIYINYRIIKKILWLIYNEQMKKNISNYQIKNKFSITQYFINVTYNCVPKSKYNYKLCIIIAFDNTVNLGNINFHNIFNYFYFLL